MVLTVLDAEAMHVAICVIPFYLCSVCAGVLDWLQDLYKNNVAYLAVSPYIHLSQRCLCLHMAAACHAAN